MAVEASATLATDVPAHPRSKRRDFIELAVGYVLILLVIWSPRHSQRPLYIAAVAWLLIITVISFDGWKPMGFRLSATPSSLWIVGAAILLATVSVLIAARLHTLNRPDGLMRFIQLYWGYTIWAGVQQFLLQDVFLLRLLRLLPTQTSAAIAATAMFSLAHLPNPVLTPITAIFGCAACLLFLRYRNLYPLAISHAILGICIALTIPGPVDHNMRVGLGYLTYHQHHPVTPQPASLALPHSEPHPPEHPPVSPQ